MDSRRTANLSVGGFLIRALMFSLAGFMMCAGCVWADNSAPRPAVSAPFAEIEPLVTASPDDPAWGGAAVIPALTLSLGDGAKGLSPLPTSVKLLWDKQYLYIRFICSATRIISPYTKHDDPLYKGDVAEVFLDAKGDARQWIEVEVSPKNVVYDGMTTLTAAPESDVNLILDGDIISRDYWANPSWNLDKLRTAASIQKTDGRVTGWIVDLALPAGPTLQRLGMSQFGPMKMKINFLRYEYEPAGDPKSPNTLYAMNWAPVMYGCPHISPQAMGTVELK